MSEIIKLIALITLIFAILFFAPLATIASLNVLFGLNIGYSWYTWLATFWLTSAAFGGVISAAKN
jgi:hypothetical protein